MRECLKCKKDITGKHESAKFCSTSCRVMYNRKHGKKNEIKPVQMQVLYNSIMEAVEKISFPPIKVTNPNTFETFTGIQNVITQKPQKQRSYESYREAKRECETPEDWERLREEIEADQYLTKKEKDLLKNINI